MSVKLRRKKWKTVPLPFSVVVMSMSCASHSCKPAPIAGLLCVFILALFAPAGVLRAQGVLSSGDQHPTALVPAPAAINAAPAADSSSSPGLNHDSSGSAHGRTAPRDTGRSISIWDRTPLDANQLGSGVRSSRFFVPGEQPGSPWTGLRPWGDEPKDLESIFREARGTSAPSFGRGMNSVGLGTGMNGAHGAAPGGFKFDSQARGNLGMYMKSPADNFHSTYNDALGTRSNGLGVAAGQGSVRATFNSSTFGNGMFKFSATTMLGSGPTAGSMQHVGSMGGAGLGSPSAPGGTGAHPTTSLSLHLRF